MATTKKTRSTDRRNGSAKAAGGAKATGGAKAAGGAEKAKLLEQLARATGCGRDEIELRALRELSASLGLGAKPKAAKPAPAQPAKPAPAQPAKPAPAQPAKPVPAAESRALPQRLYLLLDGRGLDGRGMPIEVIDLPAIIGSGKRCTVWINSPGIETRHLQITHEDDGWILEDLGSEKGTLLGDAPVTRRTIADGDEYRLAGYLRLRTELR
jgi:hypothetical protein